LGMPTKRMENFGNIKFDATLPENTQRDGQAFREQIGVERPVWIAASTHEAENEMVLHAFDTIRKTFPTCLLLLILRHPEEADSVVSLCKSNNYKSIMRSSQARCAPDIDIFIGDTLGELMIFYAASDVAFVGGSLVPIGGHNILEPALLELPIITGPHMFHSTKIVELFQKSNAMIMVQNTEELAQHVIQFLEDQNLREAFGTRAKTIVETNQGALEKHLQLINELLGSD
jgi:3-deoxy-D-manno-octulosonic-acid transferase